MANNNSMFGSMFDGMFKPIDGDCCKIGYNGQIAIKTSTGYKTYNVEKNSLTNCDRFAMNVNNAFWAVPCFKVERGDIILVNEKPCCVIEVGSNSIKTFSYENSTINETIPEHHVFMGKTYCYRKIFSPFINMFKDESGIQKIMKMEMMMNMFGNNGQIVDATKPTNNDGNPMSAMFSGINPMMAMCMFGGNNPFTEMFDGAFNFGPDDNETDTAKEN